MVGMVAFNSELCDPPRAKCNVCLFGTLPCAPLLQGRVTKGIRLRLRVCPRGRGGQQFSLDRSGCMWRLNANIREAACHITNHKDKKSLMAHFTLLLCIHLSGSVPLSFSLYGSLLKPCCQTNSSSPDAGVTTFKECNLSPRLRHISLTVRLWLPVLRRLSLVWPL